MYSEYEQMIGERNKVTYVVSYLSIKYDVSERKVYGVIKHFKKDCIFGAV